METARRPRKAGGAIADFTLFSTGRTPPESDSIMHADEN